MIRERLRRRPARCCGLATTALAAVLLGPHVRPAHAQSTDPLGDDPELVSVRFAPGAAHLREGRLLDRAGRPLATLERLIDEVARRDGEGVRRLFPLSAARLDRLRVEAARTDPGAVSRLDSWVRILVRPQASAADLVVRLNARPEVDTAYVLPEPVPPPAFGGDEVTLPNAASPDLASKQTYFGPAPLGIDAGFGREYPGGDGRGVRIVEIESDWVLSHEDLELPDATRLVGTECESAGGECFPDHGTSVLGVLSARNNGYGITGGVPAAEIRVLTPRFEGRYDPAAALAMAADATRPGDVILIELQAAGPRGPSRYVPVEWIPEVGEAIRALSAAGRVVVEPAGNGAEDLDHPAYGNRFRREHFDSGALLIGGGDSTRSPIPTTNYGSRLDLQGWGCCVTTTGAGDDELPRAILARSYRRNFGGTSSAAAVVAAAVASVQGVALELHGAPLTGRQIVSLLADTGTPQGGGTGRRIGPLPDLRSAISRYATFESLISAEDAVVDLLRGDRLADSHRRHLDLLGNADGSFDAGDVAALLDRRRGTEGRP